MRFLVSFLSLPHFPLYLERRWGGCFAMVTGWLEFWVELSPKNAAFFKGPNLLANYTNLSREPQPIAAPSRMFHVFTYPPIQNGDFPLLC